MGLSETLLNAWIVLLMISVVGFAQEDASEVQNVRLLSELSPMQNSSWVSPNRNFALGFSQVSSNEYLLSIWFSKISAKTIVWSANRDMLVSEGSKLKLTGDGNLVLTDSRGSIVWESKTGSLNVIRAEVEDTGNFVLLDNSSKSVWESFNSPTDTLLPGQILKQGSSLTSSQTPSSVASGNYRFTLLSGGQLSLYNQNLSSDIASSWYWPDIYDLTDAGPATFTIGAAGDFGLYNGVNGSTVLMFITPDYGLLLPRRMTLDADGNLRMYSWDRSSGSWVQMWKAVDSECGIDGLCGPYGICSIDAFMARARCSCPPGFHPVDPHLASKGCAITDPYACGNGLSKFVTLENTDFPREFDYRFQSNISQLDCAQICSNDCSCIGIAYSVDGTAKCYFKNGGLMNGRTTSDLAVRFLLKVASSQILPPSQAPDQQSLSMPDGFAAPNPSDASASKGSDSRRDIAIAIVSSSALSACLAFILMHYMKRSPRPQAPGKPIGALRHFSYKELRTATKNFSEMLGTGGFGSVYKGLLSDLGYVAVKKLDRLHQGEKEFTAEVQTIGSIHHMNLVRLHGYCSERSHRLLVYEYLSQGSLEKFLFQNSPSEKHLEWSVRLKIAVGTARGIAYLHEECRECIIHCDIKPQNILLDDRFTPVVSDFGLAKLLDHDKTRTFTALRGTRGYVAPEWIFNRAITVKADVYSYGMVLLELLAGRRNFEPQSSRFNFADWAMEKVKKGEIRDVAAREVLLDSGEAESQLQLRLQEVERVVKLALWCIEDDPSTRPTMGKVVQILEGALEVSDPPSIFSESSTSTRHAYDPSHHHHHSSSSRDDSSGKSNLQEKDYISSISR